LDYLNLVSKFDGKTIKLPVLVAPATSIVRPSGLIHHMIIDTGADTTALTEEFLRKSGYDNFQNSGIKKRTATGEIELLTCDVIGITIANQFKVGKITVDVLSGWDEHTVVGVIGMDILSRMTFILSHEHKKFMLTGQKVPELESLF